MAFAPSFETKQVIGQPGILIVEDTSTGTDAAISTRHIYLQKADGTYLVPAGNATDYIVWPVGTPTKAIDALDRDYALRVTVLWVSSGGATLYTQSGLKTATLHLKQFYYDLTQTQSGTPNIVNDTRYYMSKIKLRCALDETENATEIGADHYAAQAALDRGQHLVDHQTLYF
jgi:hypothetical protein